MRSRIEKFAGTRHVNSMGPWRAAAQQGAGFRRVEGGRRRARIAGPVVRPDRAVGRDAAALEGLLHDDRPVDGHVKARRTSGRRKGGRAELSIIA